MEQMLPFGRLGAAAVAGSGGGAAWTPASLPNLLAWYTAGIGTYSDAGVTPATNTQTIQQQNDRSGHAYHLKQATAGNRPQYLSGGFNSRPTIQLATVGSKGMASDAGVAMGTGTKCSCFIVGQMLTATPLGGVAACYAGAGISAAATGSIIFRQRNFAATNFINTYFPALGEAGTQAVSLATNYRFGMTQDYDGVSTFTWKPYLNGVVGTSDIQNIGLISFVDAGRFALGARIDAAGAVSGQFWDGPISEVVITNDAMTPANIALLDSYSQTTWGL